MRRHSLLAASLLLAGSAATAATEPGPALDLANLGARSNIGLLQGLGLPGSVQDLYLEVYLNGVRTQRVLHVAVDASNRLHAWPENLRDSGLRVSDETYVALDALDGISHRYDVPNQRLYFDTDASRLYLRAQRFGRSTVQTWPATIDPGVLLNYDSYATVGDYGSTLSVGHALRGFSDWGILETSGYSHFSDQGDGNEPYTRLDTVWSNPDPDALSRLSVGDFIAGNLSWTRATRMGGVQLRRDFGLQPGLLTYPIPQFFGEAALPSTIELYVDGVRQYEGRTPPGPFELVTPPSITGAGQAVVVLTDALGRSQSYNFEFYNANRLLRAGLSDYSASAGAVRRHYGLKSFDYRSEAAAIVSGAYGLSDWITVEGHAEGSESLQMSGVGAVARLGQWGTTRGNAAYSTARTMPGSARDDGHQLGIGYNLTIRSYTFDYSIQRSSGDFLDLAAAEGRSPSQRTEQALIGAGYGDFGISANYIRLDAGADERYRAVGLNANSFLRHSISLYAGINHRLDDHETTYFAGLSSSFGAEVSGGVGINHGDGSTSVDTYLSRALPSDGGHGWMLRSAHTRNTDRYLGEAGYRGRYGTLRGGMESINSDTHAYASASGAAVLMDNTLMFAREAPNGFALVDTNGVAGVPVLQENRPIGTTDASGHYLVAQLNPYQQNRVAIDPLHLPVDIQAARTVMQAIPAERSGLVLNFELRQSRSALLVLHDMDGAVIAPGSSVLREGAAIQVVGFDGQVYLENLSAQNRLQVIRADIEECTVSFDYPATSSGIPQIGPLQCLP